MKHLTFKFLFVLFIGIFTLSCNEAEIQKQIDAELIQPYFELIKAEKYEDAYQKFTNDFYKKNNSLADFTNSYRQNTQKRGEFIGFQTGLFRVQYSLGGGNEIRYEVDLQFKNEEIPKAVIYTIRQDDQSKYSIEVGWHNKRYQIPDGIDGPF